MNATELSAAKRNRPGRSSGPDITRGERPINLIFRARVRLRLAVMMVAASLGNAAADDAISFNRHVRPILADKCFPCHGPDAHARKADLRLDRFNSEGDVSGAETVLVGGDLQASELVRRISTADDDQRMPPAKAPRKLNPAEIALLRRWVEQGAEYEQHWSFVAPVRPPLPTVQNTSWTRNAIDRFVLARLEREGLQPSPPAEPTSMVRRVSLDLIGLPPDPEMLAAAPSEHNYQRLVEDLLNSPRYGEHWATMWLDAARYADTNGYNNDTPRYNWKYREWVIQALNRNLPYDEFVTEQLAGDLLPGATLEQQIASGFNRNHNVTSEGGIVDEEYRLEYVADRVQTTSTVFMALTVGCARCHDHKFDPLTQREYYEFFAFFNQVPETGYHKEHVGNPHPVVQAPSPEQAEQLARLTADLEACEQQLARRAEPLSDEQRQQDDQFLRLTKLKSELLERQKLLRDAIPTAMVMRDLPAPRETFLLRRGAYDQPTDQVDSDVPSALPPFPEGAPRNRLGFSQWLVSKNHPLTARVIVNRLWAELFGAGLVSTLEDFGTQGATPTHPDLLDWLAVELMDSGWDLRHLLRLIVSSSTYRQSPRVTPNLIKRDPTNRLFARGPRFRLKAEVIRDSALSVSGLLVNQLGGPSVRPYQPAGLWTEVAVADDSYSGGPYVQSQGAQLYRRSLYTWWKRTCPPPNLNTFDAPEREFCLVQRSRTNTPLQALVLMNDPTFVEAARKLAERMIREGGNDPQERLAFGFRLATARHPEPQEIDILTAAWEACQTRFAAHHGSAEELLQVGESTSERLLCDSDVAAYAAVANMILNLDEFVIK